MLFDQRGGREVGDAVAVAAGGQFVDAVEHGQVGHGVLRGGTTSVRRYGIVGRAASEVANWATTVIGCRQRGQSRVAVGSNGSRVRRVAEMWSGPVAAGAVRTGLIRATKVQ
ncbi:hypothetical protein IQ62_34905 [Streptomyces scabiei]|uniref:hypothetical protein n=1 Tax=Streptomyces scabiei TaxID=1930 RepID=UPI0004E786EF|nr:hypothetical protein [Streptomyces scabiei]KFF96699.1 hypothetical protein IQ62_34905 [Streptomyces scabiei]